MLPIGEAQQIADAIWFYPYKPTALFQDSLFFLYMLVGSGCRTFHFVSECPQFDQRTSVAWFSLYLTFPVLPIKRL